MTGRVRRVVEGALGLVAVTGAVVWLSGGFGERVAPEIVDLPGLRVADGSVIAVEEVTGLALEWASGEIASARHTSVASRVLARIEEIRVRAGSNVSKGDVLVKLDARDLEARVGEAREALRATEARLELARQEHARTQELFRSGVAPQQRLDEVTSELRAVRAELTGRKEALNQTTTAASFAEIRSPVSGRVIDRLAEPGDTAIPGQPLLRIYDPTLLRVEAPVRESLAVRLNVGDTLRVDVPALGRPVDGRIDEIVPFAERGARTLLVKVSFPRSDARLFAGMYARVAIQAAERRRLLVPEAAIERIGQLEFAIVVGAENVIERRLVTTGERSQDGRVEVLSGLTAGERVLVPKASSAGALERPPEAAAAIGRLRDVLGKTLRQAIARGPAQAIEVCRVEAPRLTGAQAAPGISMGRTSHRLRNPANAPEAWMLPFLEEFRGSEPQPGSFRTVDLGPRGQGYVEPIYLKPLCATCHGESVAPDLLVRIREHYPDDDAIGFRVGEFRGLFWAVVEKTKS